MEKRRKSRRNFPWVYDTQSKSHSLSGETLSDTPKIIYEIYVVRAGDRNGNLVLDFDWILIAASFASDTVDNDLRTSVSEH